RFGRLLVHPVVAWMTLALAIVVWHLPRFYELGLQSPGWHQFQHGCFFTAGVLFWWPVVEVWPGRAVWPRWALIPYLLLADMVNTGLSAFLTFSDHVLYRSYELAPRLGG